MTTGRNYAPNRTRQLVEFLATCSKPATIAEISVALGCTAHRVTNTVSMARQRLYLRRNNPGEKFATYVITTAGRQALKDPDGFRDPRAKPLDRSETLAPEAVVASALRTRPQLATVWGASP